jgi:hypothetical protein
MGLGVVLWVAGKKFFAKNVAKDILPFRFTGQFAVHYLFHISGNFPLKQDALNWRPAGPN